MGGIPPPLALWAMCITPRLMVLFIAEWEVNLSCTGSVLRIIYRKRKRWNGSPPSTAVPAKPYSVDVYRIIRNSLSYSKGRVWAAPTGFPIIQGPFCGTKSPVKPGEAVNGNTILKMIDFLFYFAFYLKR